MINSSFEGKQRWTWLPGWFICCSNRLGTTWSKAFLWVSSPCRPPLLLSSPCLRFPSRHDHDWENRDGHGDGNGQSDLPQLHQRRCPPQEWMVGDSAAPCHDCSRNTSWSGGSSSPTCILLQVLGGLLSWGWLCFALGLLDLPLLLLLLLPESPRHLLRWIYILKN